MEQEPSGARRSFDPSRYLTKVGSSDYLEVKWRLVWLREVHPDAVIETDAIKVIPPDSDPEGNMIGWAMFKARVSIPSGGSATGYGSESVADFREYIEKAETKAIGRALAALGFGTQFSADHDFGAGAQGGRQKVVDSPVDYAATRGRREPQDQQQGQQGPPQQGQPQEPRAGGTMNPNAPASPRQKKFVLDLIGNQGENPADFEDMVNVMNAGKASEWIQKLQHGVLPWLEVVSDAPKR